MAALADLATRCPDGFGAEEAHWAALATIQARLTFSTNFFHRDRAHATFKSRLKHTAFALHRKELQTGGAHLAHAPDANTARGAKGKAIKQKPSDHSNLLTFLTNGHPYNLTSNAGTSSEPTFRYDLVRPSDHPDLGWLTNITCCFQLRRTIGFWHILQGAHCEVQARSGPHAGHVCGRLANTSRHVGHEALHVSCRTAPAWYIRVSGAQVDEEITILSLAGHDRKGKVAQSHPRHGHPTAVCLQPIFTWWTWPSPTAPPLATRNYSSTRFPRCLPTLPSDPNSQHLARTSRARASFKCCHTSAHRQPRAS